MAPESYFEETNDLRSDVWMFGVLLWGVFGPALHAAHAVRRGLQQRAAAVGRAARGEQGRATAAGRNKPAQSARLAFAPLHVLDSAAAECSQELYSIMQSCWQRDPAERVSAEAIHAQLRAHTSALTERRKTAGPWTSLNTMMVQDKRADFAQDAGLQSALRDSVDLSNEAALNALHVPACAPHWRAMCCFTCRSGHCD